MRARVGRAVAAGVVGTLLSLPAAWALEDRFADLPATVEVAQVFLLSIDNPHLAFGQVTPSATIVLGRDRYFHEVRCRSNTGRPWYLKAQLLSLKHLESAYALPPGSLKWKLVEARGSAGLARDFQPFADQPVLVYASQGDNEQAGAPVGLRFQYSLTAPADAPAGTYIGQILFTMAEIP